MKVYEPSNIRNIAATGHAGSGKTSLVEALLYKSGALTRKGTVEDKNTTSDFNEIEQTRGSSIFSAPVFTEWKDKKINIIDTPGYDDYVGEMIAPLHVCDMGMIVINSQNGVEVGSELSWSYSAKFNKPNFFVVNKLDVENSDFDKVVNDIKICLSKSARAVQFPVKTGAGFNAIVDLLKMKQIEFDASGNAKESDIPADLMERAEDYRNSLVESIAETDENLMNKYFEKGELSEDEIINGLKAGIKSRGVFPILCASSRNNAGIDTLLDFISEYLPSPCDLPLLLADGTATKCDAKAHTSLFIYKLFSDSKLGDMTYFRVNTGKLEQGADMLVEGSGQPERIGQIFCIKGKNRVDVSQIPAGDIGATVKLKNTKINNTLHEKNFAVDYAKIAYPNSKVRLAIVPKTKGEEEKVGLGLHSLHNEDPTIVVEHSQELRQTIVHCQGELHSGVIKYRLQNRYKVEATYIEPRVPYRETIQKMTNSTYRHKKQSGGAGQFAEVHMRIEPWIENMPNPAGLTVRSKELIELEWGGKLEYVNCIVGGVIDARFMPAILKGVMDKMQFGPLTGSYVRDVRVSIFDGKMHPVDSNEAAFKTAGMMAFKDGFTGASPKILEPIYSVEIRVPVTFVGDIMGDLPTRRGTILGGDTEGSYQKIKARMPLAELDKYSTGLRSMTQARATYSAEFLEYAPVPPNVQLELVEAYKKAETEAHAH